MPQPQTAPRISARANPSLNTILSMTSPERYSLMVGALSIAERLLKPSMQLLLSPNVYTLLSLVWTIVTLSPHHTPMASTSSFTLVGFFLEVVSPVPS